MTTASRPIFVLGTAFSGSTVLSWALAQHPRLTHALETRWLARLAGDLQLLLDAGLAEPGHSRLADGPDDRSRFYEAFGSAVNRLLVSDGSLAAERRRWVDGTPRQAMQVAGLVRLFPEAQFIHVLRDVRSVVPLLVSRPLPGRPAHTEKSAYQHWLRTSRAILEAELAFGPRRILRLSYGDIVRDPERALRRCLRFVNEPFCADCLRPFNGLSHTAAGLDARPHDERGRSAVRREAELLSDLLLQAGAPNPERIARLDEAFARRIRRDRLRRTSQPLVHRVREAAQGMLPAEANVLVVSKGDDELLKLGTVRRASHFPQTAGGVYAGFHPATSGDAIAHLEELRKKGHNYLLIPGPYFWWLDYYRDFAEHLRRKYRIVYYQENNCAIVELARTPRGWSAPFGGGGRGNGTAARTSPPAAARTSPARAVAAGPGVEARPTPAARPDRPDSAIKPLAQKLWSGFSTYARPALEEACGSAAMPTRDRVEAAWELARWHAVRDDPEATLGWLQRLAALCPAERLTKRHLLLEVRTELRLGQVDAAQSLIALATARYGHDADVCLLSSNALMTTPRADDDRLAWVNRLLARHHLHPIRRIDPHLPLAIDNITSAALGPTIVTTGPKVSVVLPAYNAGETIGFALRGLREQTWVNLEILVVDDASTDDTRDVVSAIAADDPRITLVALDENRGAYVARNVGFQRATGDYVTVHDADDWSHAEKIERQVAYLTAHDVVGVLTCWSRVLRQLQFNGAWRPNEKLLEENFSSLMLPTDVVRDLGGWDPVRTGADTEFRRRLELKHGKARVSAILTDVPLSFSLDDERSLTRQRATHISSLHYGVRREYHRLHERWHAAAAASGDYRVSGDPGAVRRFPAPAAILSARERCREYDVVLACDFALIGGAFVSPYHYVLAALNEGLRVGVFHWPRYDLRPGRRLDERLARLVDEGRIDTIVAGQDAKTRDLVLYYPKVFQYRLDVAPALQFDRMHVVVNQMASRFYSGEDPQYDPATVGENLRALFGSSGEWFPISPLVRTLMAADARYPPAGEATWIPLLDTNRWCVRPIAWRGSQRSSPIIGRHGRDHPSKWPQAREAIEQAYCVRSGWETRFLGGAEQAIARLGGRPKTWRTWPYGALDVQAFLHDLDFLVHVPHEDYIEEFGRVAMEAMAVGIPVILPPRFATTFGDAATYGEAGDVADQISAIWRDEARYVARARAGREFVLRYCSLDQFRRRLSS